MTKQEFKQRRIKLRKRDLTLGEMVKILKRPKTTIYFHVRQIPISTILKEKIAKIYREKAALAHPPKGVSILNRHCFDFGEWNREKVSLIAHAMFDGEIHLSRGVAYNNRSLVLINQFKRNMNLLYKHKPHLYINKKTKVVRLSYYNVELGSLFKNKAIELTAKILNFPLEFKRTFLQSFFNDEGAIYFRGTIRRIKGYQYNDKILFIVQKLLKYFDIESMVDSRFHEITIGRRENLEKFAKEINFTPGLCVNGDRPNSIWKKSLEKREILNMALKSYLN